MGTKKFVIKTFESFTTPVVEFEKKVYDHDGNALLITPGKKEPTVRGFNSFSIDIHEIGEEEESKRISLKAITEGKPIMFRSIDLNDVVGKVVVQSELIRTKNSNPISPHIAFSNLTVLSRNRSVAFYVDEVEDVGGNALPITPGETLDKMFVIKNMNPLGVEPPTLVYHKKFKNFFNNGDDYETVKCIMLLIGLPYCEQLLKWIVFGKPDYGKEEHQVIINLIGELCFYREKDLEEITNEADDDKKVQSYLKLSNLLFENVQGMGMGWKKMLRQIVENEKK